MKYGNQFLVKYLANVIKNAVVVKPKPITPKTISIDIGIFLLASSSEILIRLDYED